MLATERTNLTVNNSQHLTVTPVTPMLGAEIANIDLSQPLTSAQADALYDCLIAHSVIFFRDQSVPPAQHMALAESFGTVDDPHPVYAHVDGYDSIMVLANDANNPPDTDGWHTDVTYHADPPFASLLVARDLPPCGGDTLWASMYAAWESLPQAMQQWLPELRAVHDMGDFRNNFTVGEKTTDKLDNAMLTFGQAIHDVVKTHPVSGKRYLYVNEGFTNHIVGMTTRESRRLLNFLFDHINRPEHQVRFSWRPGSVAMWDNRCTQHYAVADYLPHYRCMHRITIVADRRSSTS